jgi:hypothetical protein
VFANVANYIVQVGNPLVASDSWYFINAFLEKAVEVGPGFQDFFVKRNALDHAQPLVKLLLWFNAQWLGLDYVFEALMGLLFAAATLLVIVRTTRGDMRALHPEWLRVLILGAAAAVLVTLNSGMVFNWSLVSLVFIPYLLAMIGAACAWQAVSAGRHLGLLLAALLLAFSQDDVGLIINAALIVAVGLASLKLRRRRDGLMAVAVIVAAEVCYLVVSRLFFHPVAGASHESGVLGVLQALWSHHAESWDVVRIVFGSTLAHINPLLYYFPDSAFAWQSALAVVVMAAHVWFWWRAFRGAWNRPVFYAVSVMVLFYALMAGLLYARIPEYGINYLNEPRYVAFYLLSNLALVLMLMGQPLQATRPSLRVAAGLALATLMVLQIPLSRFTWYEGRYLSAYYHAMAREMLELGAGTPLQSCVPLLTVCNMPPADRDNAVQFLKRHKLNVYSDTFVERYRLQALVPPEQHPVH